MNIPASQGAQGKGFYLFSRGWRYAGEQRRYVVLYLFLMICAQTVSLTEPLWIGKALNAMQTSVGNREMLREVLFYLGLYAGAQFVFWIFHGPARVIERMVAYQVRINQTKALFSAVTELPLRWHREHHSGESIDKIKRATQALYEFMSGLFELVYMLFGLFGSILMLIWFLPSSGAAAVFATGVAFIVVFCFDQALYRHYLEINRGENRVASAIHDYVTNIVSVITLRLESRVQNEVIRRAVAWFTLFRWNIRLHELKWFLVNMIITLMIAVVLGCYAWSLAGSSQALLAGSFFTLFEYLRRIGNTFFTFAYKYGDTVKQAADVRSAETILDSWSVLAPKVVSTGLPDNWKEIVISDLHFVYEDEEHRTHHLRNVELHLKRGKAIAIVGESGSGKSTLLALIRGIQSTQQAKVSCDGGMLPNGLSQLAHYTTLLPQDPEIFADTIRFNVTLGIEATDNEIMSALTDARFDGVLKRLPRGLDTNVAEKGVNLSGGERQRLACARGIYFARESQIILLDEATSSVDVANERHMYENFLRLFKERSLVCSLHKLHLLSLFDEIYVFVDGEVAERGTLSELLAHNGVLRRMWNAYQVDRTNIEASRDAH